MLFLYVIYTISFIKIYVLGVDALYKTLSLVNLEPNTLNFTRVKNEPICESE